MTDLTKLFDNYSRNARLYPALLTLFPALISFVAWFPQYATSKLGLALISILATCGVLYVLAVFSRTLGKKQERRLLKEWGGWPTTIWLRHSSPQLSHNTRARYHAFLSGHVPGLVLPSQKQELADAVRADQAYASAVKWLQEQCRGEDFTLLHKENTEYGFRRNLLGLKCLGLTVAALALIISWILVLAKGPAPLASQSAAVWVLTVLTKTSPLIVGAMVLDLLAIVVWLIVVQDSWVREAGDRYAEALLACCDRLNKVPTSG